MSDSGKNVVGLFAGVGGLEVGLQRAGHRIVRLCESDAAAQEVLQERFKEAELDGDVRELKRLPPETEVLALGFPCQDLSQVGTTNGINGQKSGVVTNVFRLLERKRVPWVLIENVPFTLHLNRGSGITFLIERLEGLGYRWAYRVVDSRAFGLPQRRLRLYLLASRATDPAPALLNQDAENHVTNDDYRNRACGFYWTEGNKGLGWAVDAIPPLKGGSDAGIPSAPGIWLPNGRVVTPDIRDAERLQGFRTNWTKPALRAAKPGYRWRLVGNSVSVPVARWLGEVINKEPAELRGLPVPLASRGRWPSAAFGSTKGRFGYRVSSWPVSRASTPLAEFLRYPPRALSEKALAGFASRLKRSNLSYPKEFLYALERNLIGFHTG